MSEASSLPLVRLLQLASPALPVGAYTYSQGLEWAVESGRITDEASSGHWIGDLLTHAIGRFEAPLVARLMQHWQADECAEIARLNADFLASRESAELRAETVQMGFSLDRLLADLRDPTLASLREAVAAMKAATRSAANSGDKARDKAAMSRRPCKAGQGWRCSIAPRKRSASTVPGK